MIKWQSLGDGQWVAQDGDHYFRIVTLPDGEGAELHHRTGKGDMSVVSYPGTDKAADAALAYVQTGKKPAAGGWLPSTGTTTNDPFASLTYSTPITFNATTMPYTISSGVTTLTNTTVSVEELRKALENVTVSAEKLAATTDVLESEGG